MNAETIGVVGLPGCGKTRLLSALQSTSLKAQLVEVMPSANTKIHASYDQIWCVIDIRAPLANEHAEQYLKALLQQSHRIILSFVESAELTQQTFWQSWLKQAQEELALHLPKHRWFQGRLALPDSAFEKMPARLDSPLPTLSHYQSFQFEFEQGKRIHLEHLLFGLDASKQNLNMAIWRVKGVVETHDYAHAVAIEGSIHSWQTFPADLPDKKGGLVIEGVGLDDEFLTQIVQASQL